MLKAKLQFLTKYFISQIKHHTFKHNEKCLLPGSKPRWGPSGRGLHVGGEGLGGRTHIWPDWDWQDSGELDGDGDWRWQY